MTIYGWDLSHYDGPDSTRAIAEGFEFLTHKAGGDANDSELAAWWDYMKGYRDRVLLGAYWVLYPGNPSGRADAFIARLDSQCDGWRNGPFILQIDAEIWGGDSSTKPSVSECNAFADRLQEVMPKLCPIGYLPEWVYGSSVSAFRYPLWASSYVSTGGATSYAASALYPGDSSSHWDAYGGNAPDILQFTSSATIAGQTTCDANAYRGTLQQLTALLAPGWADDMALTADDKNWIVANVGPQAVASKLYVDMTTPTSGIAKSIVSTVKTIPVAPTAAEVATAVWAAMPAPEQVDVPALAAALAPLLNGMTVEQIREVFESARVSFTS